MTKNVKNELKLIKKGLKMTKNVKNESKLIKKKIFYICFNHKLISMKKSLFFLVLLSFIKCSSDLEVNYDNQEAPSVFQSSITSNASVGGNQ